MKKWIIVAAILVLLFLTVSYLAIPEKVDVTKSVTAKANLAGVHRFLTSEPNWVKWWPGTVSHAGSEPVFESGGYRFKKNRVLYQSFEMSITKGENTYNGLLNIFLLGSDSITIKWTTTINNGKNPITKILNRNAEDVGRQIENILAAMQKYVSNEQNVYGINIRKEKVKVEYLITTKGQFESYPTTENVYDLINQLKKYVAQRNAKEEDFPMMHVSTPDRKHFDVQVAIPVDKNLPSTEKFVSKKMLKGGDILVAETTGEGSKADTAMKRMEQYVFDHRYTAIAIPFQSLVTNRLNETDSSKWVTKIYYPVIL